MDLLTSLLEKKKVSQDSLDIIYSNINLDSIKRKFLINVSYFHLNNQDSLEFRKWNTKLLSYSKIKSDTSALAEGYWDLASFFNKSQKFDSAYYYYNRSSKLYKEIGNDFRYARMLLNQAIIQSKVKDYQGSETSTFKAIDILKTLGENKQLYLAYNNLGVIHSNIGNYKKSIEYHNFAISYNENQNNPYYEITSLNNIGVVYTKIKQYPSAIKTFENALSQKVGMNPRLHAKLLDNLGHANILNGNFKKGYPLLQEALNDRKNINHKPGIVMSYIHLGDYHRLQRDKKKAKKYYTKAVYFSKPLNMDAELLELYLSLSEVDKENENDYLKAHIDLTSKLKEEERSIQNQFARIRYDTDQITKRADNLNQQKTYLILGILTLLSLLILTYIIQRQISRNKKLVLVRQQQESNEKIYDLLLRSQQKYEEGSISERKRISRDLHDSILSKFFGIRINLEVLNNKGDAISKQKRSSYLEDLKSIENEIRNISHKLNVDNDFSEIGFLDILKDLFYEFEKLDNFKINFFNSSQIDWGDIKNNIKINFYRIIQESLQNIRKHANAENVEVRMEFDDAHLILSINDDGQGFETEAKFKGIGLKNIQDRVKEIGGKFNLVSNSNGTKINITLLKKDL